MRLTQHYAQQNGRCAAYVSPEVPAHPRIYDGISEGDTREKADNVVFWTVENYQTEDVSIKRKIVIRNEGEWD